MESQVRKINVRCPIKEDQKWVEAEGINAYSGIEHGPAASKAHQSTPLPPSLPFSFNIKS